MISSLTFNFGIEETMVKKKTETFDICDLLKNNTSEAISQKSFQRKPKKLLKGKHRLQEWESVEPTVWNSY